MKFIRSLLLLDNNCLNALQSSTNRMRLQASMRVAGWEFWPTASNALEAVTTTDRDKRTRLLAALSELAGENHALPLATHVLQAIAESISAEAPTLRLGEPTWTSFFRDPESVTDDEVEHVREHLIAQEGRFDDTHGRAWDDIRPELKKMGGHRRWPSVGEFLDEVWTTVSHLDSYFRRLWSLWGLPGDAPVDVLFANEAWRLYFDGWGAALYARTLAHPQPGLVEGTDLEQLTYLGLASTRVFVTEDRAFRDLGNAVLRGRYLLAELVPLTAVL